MSTMTLEQLVAIEGYADEYGTVTDEMLTMLIDFANAHLTSREAKVDDFVSIPRGLIGAACRAIDMKHDAPKTLAELRRYTYGDLSTPAAQEAAITPGPITEDELKRAWNMIGQAHPEKEWVKRALTAFLELRLAAQEAAKPVNGPLDGLADLLNEISEMLSSNAGFVQYMPGYRFAMADELRGFALMIAATLDGGE
jgi:hypothetical protein